MHIVKQINVFSTWVVIEARILPGLQPDDTGLYWMPSVDFWTEQERRGIGTFIPHLRARVDVETHVIVAQGGCCMVQ